MILGSSMNMNLDHLCQYKSKLATSQIFDYLLIYHCNAYGCSNILENKLEKYILKKKHLRRRGNLRLLND